MGYRPAGRQRDLVVLDSRDDKFFCEARPQCDNLYLQCRDGVPMMVTKIQKWGNSLALRIPKGLAEAAGLEQGKPVKIRYENGELRIATRRRKRYDLDKMLASVPDDFEPEDWDIGPPVGNEVW